VSTAQDGREALALADLPDLILLDLRLPQIDEYQVCRQHKTRTETQRIPIVMLTAMSAIRDKVKGLMYGADEYLSKPVRGPGAPGRGGGQDSGQGPRLTAGLAVEEAIPCTG